MGILDAQDRRSGSRGSSLRNGQLRWRVIGPVWHGDYQPADGREGVYRKEYSNEPGTANETYDAGAKAYSQTIDGTAEVTATESWTIQVGGCTIQANKDGTMTIMASKKITINAPEVEFLEKVTIKKRPPSKRPCLSKSRSPPTMELLQRTMSRLERSACSSTSTLRRA